MSQELIKATVTIEKSNWVVFFERNNQNNYAVARVIFGDEPTEPELYEYITRGFYHLKFSQPKKRKLIFKNKNYKRIQREVKK